MRALVNLLVLLLVPLLTQEVDAKGTTRKNGKKTAAKIAAETGGGGGDLTDAMADALSGSGIRSAGLHRAETKKKRRRKKNGVAGETVDELNMAARTQARERAIEKAARMVKNKPGEPFKGTPPRVVDQNLYGTLKERQRTFEANGYVWPITTRFVGWPPKPNGSVTEEFLKTRLQLADYYKKVAVSSHHKVDHWDNLMASMLLPRFSPKGFMRRQCEGELKDTWQKLRKNYNKMLPTAEKESFDPMLHTGKDGVDYRPRFIDNKIQRKLNAQTLQQMQKIAEAWCGVKLEASTVYGLRVYGNGSTLASHTDKPTTHIISAILHVDHDTTEPWPIEIEDRACL